MNGKVIQARYVIYNLRNGKFFELYEGMCDNFNIWQ